MSEAESTPAPLPLPTPLPASLLEYVREAVLAEPEQRTFNGVRVPLVLEWTHPERTGEACARFLGQHHALLVQRLGVHGGVLFRGFPLQTAHDFHDFVVAFPELRNLSYEESLSFAVRLDITERICTTNEGKNGGLVFHHEQAQTPLFPSKIFFFCERPADVGGGTGICPSDVVLQQLERAHPDFVRSCEAHGVIYSATLGAEQDASKGAGRGWRSYFARETKEGVEARMRELGYTWEWLENGALHITTPRLPAIRIAPNTGGRRVFFNQVVAQIANAREFSGSETPNMDRFLRFGDGSSVDPTILSHAKQLCDDTAVEIQWQAGDVAFLDNYLVMHARRKFEGPRRILASLAKDACESV